MKASNDFAPFALLVVRVVRLVVEHHQMPCPQRNTFPKVGQLQPLHPDDLFLNSIIVDTVFLCRVGNSMLQESH